ncbi:tri-functional histidine biosynthesis protein [Tuber magnatum]|uniref:Histidine biosynthesis trifunctional protein n=1 Tax=Tuber magnatum TaxID=42249 RepID=A0A317T0I5_9PEZI|nr:tri-functional histidine biosynthesis protein [Tuber magnatum]
MSVPLVASLDSFSESELIPSLSLVGHVSITVGPENLDEALTFIPRNFHRFAFSVNVAALPSADDICSLLDAGASRVFVTHDQLRDLQPRVDDSRLALSVDTYQGDGKVAEAISDTSVGLYAHKITDFDFVTGWLKEYGSNDRPPVFISFGYTPSLKDVEAIGKLAATPIVAAEELTVDLVREPAKLSIGDIILAAVSSDRPDKLISTLVTDEAGIALGLVYSSPESVKESLKTGTGVYQSRKRGLWYKGATSGAVQELVRIDLDCDADCLRFVVRQKGKGFCHLETATCFGEYRGLSRLQETLTSRKESAPTGSYTARLFSDEKLLRAKIMEEAEELCQARAEEDIAFEAADLIYFALTKCIGAGVSFQDIERNLDAKSLKVTRRKGDAKQKWGGKGTAQTPPEKIEKPSGVKIDERVKMARFNSKTSTPQELEEALKRPAQRASDIMGIVTPIIESVKQRGDAALIEYAAKFDKAVGLKSAVLSAPFPPELMRLPQETTDAIDLSFENIRKFHEGQKEKGTMVVETMPGVKCSRFVRPIERVGLYIPGGTAVLPSTALMLGVPALVAGCKKIIFASPPRKDGSVTPEIVYVAQKVGAEAIVLAGGAQAVAALAYGTETVPKVDKILGPGNQFVTAGKMFVSNDTGAGVSIDMPAGPSEVLVVADAEANPAFVASDLLSQAEHGIDSQVILITVGLTEEQLVAIEEELEKQALALPRVDIVRGSISHSVTLQTDTIEEAIELSNQYAPEHLILQVKDAAKVVDLVQHAGSVFIGHWTPESVGDYSAGVNHSLPTYGYARQYSGVNLATYVKHLTSSELTEQGLRNVGGAVMQLAKVEELEAHRRAVGIRLEWLDSRR